MQPKAPQIVSLQRVRRFAASLALAACVTLTAHADSMSTIVEERQRALRDIGGASKAIGDQIKRGKIVKTMALRYSAQLKELSELLATKDLFPKGSGPETGLEMKAKAEIWTKPEDFEKYRQGLAVEAAKLDELIRAGASIDELSAQFKVMGANCSGCHKAYREED
jgi:cytochrome c556